jgi:chemosensory pili system protein ChpB (putative protein-glutamate methylesterase)
VPNIKAGQDVRVALLYQTNHLGGHLRDALKELGAAVVYEALSADIDRDALEGSGARVVIVNLDADSDAQIDHVYDLLDEGDYQVVFNDAEVSSHLSGWDHARWARNLASKILSRPDVATPARPPGAEAVPTPVQKSASFVPVAEKPGERGPVTVAEVTPAVTVPTPPAPTPASERPTVELPLPEIASAQPAESDELDIAGLGDFAEINEPAAAPAPAKPAAVAAAPPASAPSAAADFAAELDAMFAAAAPASAAAHDFDISLPPDNEATHAPVATEDDQSLDIESIELSSPVEPEATSEPHEDFPAIFDQLDEAAANVPEATDNSFKPAQLPPAAAPPKAADPVLPPEWTLEAVEDPIPDPPPGARPAPPAAKPFGIEKIGAAEFLAPKVEAPTAKQQAAVPDAGGLSLELMPMEEAIAPERVSQSFANETWLDGSRPAQKLKVGAGTGVQRLFVLGASIGGPEAVRDFLGALPAGFPALFVLAQHMGEEFLELMSAQLAKAVALTVRSPTHGERVGHGEIIVVPTTHRLQIDPEGVITMAHLPEKPPYSPSIDQVLRDVADQFGDKSGAIIFSGMAHDAIEGSKYLKSRGGTVWVQDPDTCVISSMVDGAREAGIVSFVGSPKQLAEKMIADYGKA